MQRKRGEMTLEQLDKHIQQLTVKKQLLWERMISSRQPESIIKAAEYQRQTLQQAAATSGRAYLYSPEGEFYTGMGYKTAIKIVPFDLLRNMANTPLIFSVISTRVNQVTEFSNFSLDNDRPGWTIRRRRARFDQKDYKLNDADRREIEHIATFLENGGEDAKFTVHSDFHDFLKVFPRDLLELDQGCFEVERNRKGDVISFDWVDSATIRLLETIDPRGMDLNKYVPQTFKGTEYYPYYCQVWRERILQDPHTRHDIIWYPWEMCFAVRNKSSNILKNGYGVSELEAMIRIVTWLLESMEYNGRFFTNGSSPRGFFSIQNAVSPQMINDFRMAWRTMTTGWQNAHKIPIFEGDKIQWVDMHHSNQEMEYSQWMEFLILIVCSVYKMDPAELGFKFRQQNTLFGVREQKERTEYSKDKGLKPLLKVIQKNIDKYIVSELNPNYEFVFTGVDIEDEDKKIDRDVKKLQWGMVAMQDKFREYAGREFNPDKDIILNSVYLQQKMQQMYGGGGMNQKLDEEIGGKEYGARAPFEEEEAGGKNSEKEPFEEFTEGLAKGKAEDNPIMDALIKYINLELGGGK